MIAQFMMDLKADHRTSPSLYLPHSPKLHDNCRPNSTDSGVLDLSKRRDSVETRKTPSPYASFSEEGSPPLHGPLHNPNNTLLINYHAAIHHPHHELSLKAPLPFNSPRHLDHSRPTGFHPAQNLHIPQHAMLPKQEALPHRPELPPYLIRPEAMQASQFQRSPLHPLREADSLSESGSEGHVIPSGLKLPKLKQPKEESINSESHGQYPMVVGRDGKLARPFKAYPRDPLSLTAGFMASDSLLDANSAEKYNMFRKRMLEQIHAANGGQQTVSNPKMRRLNKSLSDTSESESVPDKIPEPSQQSYPKATPTDHHPDNEPSSHRQNGNHTDGGSSNGGPNGGTQKDSAYYERRKKNNAAAKKSRDRRRIKEDEIAIRAAFLERENIELKFELAAARKQLALYGVTNGTP